MVNSAHFAKRLQKILEYYGLSATAFSEELSFNRSTISHLLSGRNKPSLEFVLKVLERFPEVELYWLLNGKGTFPTLKNKESISNSGNNQKQNEKFIASKATSSFIEKTQNFNETHNAPLNKISEELKNQNSSIERIVCFYTNGTFKEYNNN